MKMRVLESIAFFYAGLAVICAALGAHLLEDQWHDEAAPRQFSTATRILFWHSVGIWICCSSNPAMRIQGIMMAVFTAIFCGSVYSLSLGGSAGWGAVAPVGGVGMIASWIGMGISRLRRN